MLDNPLLSDSELCARVKRHSPELAALLGARLRRLRLARVVVDQGAQAAQGTSATDPKTPAASTPLQTP